MYSQGGFMRTTVFRNGGSQAIRIPAQFRFEGDSVDIEWDDSLNALLIRKSGHSKWDQFFAICETLPKFSDSDFYPVQPDGRFDVVAFMEKE
jgi:virulence-associated protein VagC